MKRELSWYDYITINVYWFALTNRAQVITPLLLPLLVQQFVGDEVKGTYVGYARLFALMVAVLMQALFGILSDYSKSKWGKRRPFILAGALGEIFLFIMIGFTAGMTGTNGYWVLFALYSLSMVSANSAHAATQGLIPDLVPENLRGRFSAVKALFEMPLPLVFVSFVIGRLAEAGNIWAIIWTTIAVFLVAMIITMFVPEEEPEQTNERIDWQPILRLVLMTAIFTVTILGMGELIKFGVSLIQGDTLTSLVMIGLISLVGIVTAIWIGVWVCIRVSVGNKVQKNRNFTFWVIHRLGFLVGATNLAGFLLFFLQERFVELSGEKAAGPAATAVMFVGVAIMVTAIPSGWLTDRFGKKPLIIASGLLAAVGTAIVLLIPNLTALYIGGAIIGSGTGFFYTASWALGTSIVPKEQAGRYLGLSNIAGAGAGAIGAYIGGPIADQHGYIVLMTIYGIMFLLSIFPIFAIKQEE